ncbi:DUF4192 domain-containing protein [Streptomyces laculatispora]|uniref:DUF4192 domain-containing protein n=1 Tax=Streptomyces laculatispora TaxID=887464 RepID=UPI001A93D2B0|nr:DUF4192 domain-containing protein [Streptomyces laculatispora]MBO0916033.1 DUF4192 domain-containing protein [Streptomyces laculatispora]
MNKHHESTGPSDEQQITLRGPAELADALPYLMGFHPNDSVVMVALHGGRGRFGGRLRLGIPQSEQEWPSVAEQLAECLVKGSERRGGRPDAIVVFLCQDPAEGETGSQIMERLRPFAQRLRTACGALDVPVLEALCISDSRYWSYCCPDARCCPVDGNPLAVPGTSVMAAAATYAGIQVRGSLREMEARLTPLAATAGTGQQQALDSAGAALLPKLLDEEGRREVGGSTLKLARRLMKRLGEAPAALPSMSDLNDDRLISHEEAAAVILGLQDRETRDRAAEWMEGPEAESAMRLWRALARRCVAPYEEHAAAPLTLAGWVAWSTGDEPAARVALGLALRLDPGYTFAQLLHEACNQGLDPETLRRCLRGERATRTVRRGHRAGRVAGARSARARAAVRRGTRTRSTRPGTATGPATARRRAGQSRTQGRRGARTRR